MKKLLLLLLTLGTALFLLLVWIDGRLSSLLPGSHLEYLETRIASVEDELMRRVPDLRKNFNRFDQCIRRVDCDVNPILTEREQLIRKNWPNLLPRLMVHNDWGTKSFTSTLHQKFLGDVQKAGGQEKITHCQPVIHYYLLSSSSTTSTYQGLRCPTANATP